MILKILENASKIKYLRRRIKNFFFLFFIDFFKNFSYNEVDNKLIEVRQNMNFDDMLYYDMEELLREPQEGEPPKLGITLNYGFVPFEEVEDSYLQLFERWK